MSTERHQQYSLLLLNSFVSAVKKENHVALVDLFVRAVNINVEVAELISLSAIGSFTHDGNAQTAARAMVGWAFRSTHLIYVLLAKYNYVLRSTTYLVYHDTVLDVFR